MKKITTERIKELLTSRPPEPMPDAESFWSDFRARASMVHQEKAVAPAPVFLSAQGWAVATACAALLAIAVGGFFLFNGETVDRSGGKMTLDVVAAHSAVLVIEDEPSHGTIVWIVGMDDAEEDDGDSV